ncbi:MAG: NADH-quinone oxidoreductase subunit NuoE [Deltaproteobacteria bacterium]|nr:NADH-quinone oxidoreductase subunit NuoE [Deltaproteobacteria bacterium]
MGEDKIDRIIDKYQGKAGSLIHVLMEIQEENQWLPREVLRKISERLEVPLSRVMQIATFYKTFSLKPKGRHEVHVCMGTACHVRGAQQILDKVQELIGIRPGETNPDGKFSLERGSCLGCCSLGPEIVVDGKHHTGMTPDKVEKILKSYD